MNIFLKREVSLESFTYGKLYVAGQYFCETLEDVERIIRENCAGKIYGQTAIEKGTYEIILNYSNRFKMYMPLLLNVRCFEGIRIHSGNRPEHTDGCILVGLERGDGALPLTHSRPAFNKLMTQIKAAEKKEKIFIEIE